MKKLLACLVSIIICCSACRKKDNDDSCLGCGAGINQRITVYLGSDTLYNYEYIIVSGIDDSLGNQVVVNITGGNGVSIAKINLPMPPPTDSILTIQPHSFTTPQNEAIYLSFLGHTYYMDAGTVKYWRYAHITGPGFSGEARGHYIGPGGQVDTFSMFWNTYNWPDYY